LAGFAGFAPSAGPKPSGGFPAVAFGGPGAVGSQLEHRSPLVSGKRPAQHRFLLADQADIKLGVWMDPHAGDVTFGEYSETWLTTSLVRGRALSPATLQGYRGLLRRNLLPRFKTTPLRDITPEAVRSWQAELSTSAGADQAAKSYRVLRSILNTAVGDELIVRNPCRVKGAGIEQAPERPIIDAATILQIAEAITPRLRALVVLAGFGGLRTGEMLALTRTDVDLVHRTVRVRAGAHEIAGVGRLVGQPKSEAGYRTVVIPRVAVEALDRHLSTYAAAGADGVVLTNPRGGPLRRATLSEHFRTATASVDGAPVRLHVHDLRHPAATMMGRMPGVTTKELMARIGHSSPRAALIYQHATEERDRAIADYLDTAVTQAQDPATEAAGGSVVKLRRKRGPGRSTAAKTRRSRR
jgi:integrase